MQQLHRGRVTLSLLFVAMLVAGTQVIGCATGVAFGQISDPKLQPLTSYCASRVAAVAHGKATTISSTASSSQNRPLTYTYTSSSGSISGDGATGTLDTSGAQPGVATITCRVADDLGHIATSTSNVVIASSTGEQAFTAYAFTDSVGVNVHLHFGNTPYVSRFPEIQQAMVQLGIRHYRNGIDSNPYPAEYNNAKSLAKLGIVGDWLIDITDSAAVINSISAQAPGSIDTFEGPNELDGEVGSQLSDFMQILSQTVRGNPATKSRKIIAPDLVLAASAATQGDFGSAVDQANIHDYYQSRHPETPAYGGPHYGCGAYGTLVYDMCIARLNAIAKPVISTETGYASGVLDDEIIGRYLPRTLFNHLNHGVMRTFFYELVDENNSRYGLMTNDLIPKPGYRAVQNVMAVLKDKVFSGPGRLDYTISGETQNVFHTLLEKSNGTFYLAVWLGVAGADPNSPTSKYTVLPQNVTISVNQPLQSATVYTLDDTGAMTSGNASVSNNSFGISVTDRITLIALPPT